MVLAPAPDGRVPRARLPVKLEQPTAGSGLIARRRLVDELVQSAARPLVALTAPPGYGKSTLLLQWAEADPRPFSWLRLDAEDNDPAVLMMYIARAVSGGGPADAEVLGGPIDDGQFLRRVALPRLGQLLRSREQPFVLVLDDAHVLTGPVWEVLGFLVDALPHGCQLVLAGRTAPELELGSLLTHRRLFQLGAGDLVMDVEEARLLARSADVDLDPADASALVRRTEGWPAGLYLASLSLRGSSDVRHSARTFSGDDPLVTAYVRDELLAPAGDEIRRFLIRSSILRTLSGPLCDAVLERTDSAAMLDAISRSNLLLVPQERNAGTYRYSQLFADVLRAELRRTRPEEEKELHARASLAYERTGEPDAAISHAHAAGDERRAAELVWREVGTRFASGNSETLERWLAGFDGKRVVRDPLLALTAAACALAAGRPVSEWLLTARHALDRPLPSARRDEDDVTLAVAIFDAVMGRRGASRMAADADVIHDLAPAGSAGHALAHLFRGIAADLAGAGSEAREQLRSAVQAAGRAALPTVQAISLAYLAHLAYLAKDWRNLGLLATRARTLMEAAQAQDFLTMASVHATVSLALAHERRAAEAEREAAHALRLLAAVAPIAPWLDVHTRAVLARTRLLLGDAAAARMLLSEAQQVVDLVPDAPELRQQLDQVWEIAQATPLSTRVGPSSITPAELRVLRYLPTHLSYAEIGDRLFLTRNTVKTQAISTYRKLGVSSRGDAVEQARSLGLLSPASGSPGQEASASAPTA